MQYSVVNYKTVKENETFRLDADFYRADYLEFLKRINLKRKYFFKKILHPIEIKRVYENSGIQILLAQNVRNNELDFSNIVFMNEEFKEELKRNKLRYDDVVLTRSGANFGQAASFKLKQDIYACADVLVIKNNGDFKGGYISTFFNTRQGRALLDRGSYGMAQPHIAPSYLYKLPIPRFNETFEKKVDDLINESEKRKCNSLNFYSKAEQLLLSELGLLDWKPKHQLAFVKNYSATIEAERIDAEYFQPKYEEIIEAVKKYKGGFDELDNLVKIKKSIEPGSEAYQENGVPFVRVSNLSKFEISTNNQQFISDELYEQLKTHQPKNGEILLSKDATPGIAYFLNEEPQKMIVSGGILRLKMNNRKVLPEYLTLVLNSVIVQKQIERDAGGSIINHWRPDQVKATIIPILKEDKQKEIKELVEKSFNDRKLSQSLLEIAKRGVEMAIEKDEQEAEKWMNNELEKINVKL
jgi:restriction endonuclease S subunit